MTYPMTFLENAPMTSDDLPMTSDDLFPDPTPLLDYKSNRGRSDWGDAHDLEIGSVLYLDDQAYELIRIDDHRRADGTTTHLRVWRSACPNCSSPFEVKTVSRLAHINRRCTSCRRPGRPVKGKRGRRIKSRIEVA